ncbi:MAG: (2Fe-2S)-binding protein, partial [Gemmobacter sp.]
MTQHDPGLAALAQLRETVAAPFERARAMPKAVYTSADFLALEQRHIFAAEWLCAGRADGLPEAGDYLTMEIAGEPVIVLR